MRKVLRKVVFCLAGCALSSAAQEEAPQAASKSKDVFSGIVVAFRPSQITVNRRGLAKDSVTRNFVIDAATKIEGDPKPNARVSVRFVRDDNGLRAINIIVR